MSEHDEERTQTVSIKSLTEDTAIVAGWGALYGGADLMGESFTKDTDFMLDLVPQKLVLYDHGLNEQVKTSIIGKATAVAKDAGLWVEAELDRHREYVDLVLKLVEKGALGWSSGTVSHLMEREGKTIKKWPIVEFSLTPTPAEPRTVGVERIKALATEAPELNSLLGNLPQDDDEPTGEAEALGDSAPSAGATKAVETENTPVEKDMENSDMSDELKALQDQVVTLEASIKDLVQKLPATNGGGVEVVKDEADQPFKSAGEYFMAVKTAALHPNMEDPRLRPLKATGLSEGVPSDGGYLVHQTYTNQILEKMYNTGRILSLLSNKDSVGPNSNGMTFNGIDETSRVDGSRQGGVLGYWVAEAGEIPASKPKFREIPLKLKKVAALCYATDELMEDTTALGSWIMRAAPEELRFKTEDAVYEGDGVGKPLGILNSPCLVSVTRTDASKVLFSDVVNMWARRWAGVSDYVWFVNQDVTPQLDQMVIGTEAPPRFVDYGADGVLRMKGKPVIEVEYASTLGTAGDIVLASMSQYKAIDKATIQAASSIHVAFVSAQQAFRFIYRIDGQPLWNSALTPFKGSNTQSPFVALSATS
jgi:HK97 family phage major capsid protein